ncbi:MAG: lipopolysaccharide heptosyltransferase II [Bacteroidales bacterium]|nr:lipopolysaccharide heptosyltransferase II [Bacteroidales bacterium]
MPTVNKILVFRLSSIGDIVLTTALLRCLRNTFPDAQIDFVVKKQFADILRCVPFVSNVIELDSKKGFSELLAIRNQLRNEQYDVALDIHKNWRSLFVCNTIGAKQVFRFNKHVFRRWVLTTFHKDIYNEVRPVYLRFIDAAQQIGVVPDGKYTELVVPEQLSKSMKDIFVQANISFEKRIIALCPGASFSNKQWQVEKFQQLAKRVVFDFDAQVILLGGKKESEMCETIANESGAVSFAGKFDLSQSIAALSMVSLTVANDTGMLHVSEALGVPVVGIYGPTARQFGYFPILPQSKVAQVDNLPCRPCTKMGMNHCPKKHFSCMNDISVEMVLALIHGINQ